MEPTPPSPDQRDPWLVSFNPPPRDSAPSELLRFALHVALTAPSPGNSQPWRFLIDSSGEQVDLFTDPARTLAHDHDGQQRTVAGGAALGLLRVALRALGLGEHTTLLPGDHPDQLARVHLTGSVTPTPEETWLLQAAPKRRTHRGLLAERPVRERLLLRLQHMAQEPGAQLLVLHTSAQRRALATRVDASPTPTDPTWPEPGPDPFEATAGGPARGDAILEGSPVLALICTADDDPRAWLGAGQALARVLLRGRVDHLCASFLHGPLARAGDRFAVAEEVAVLGDMPQGPGYAQLALRLGHGGDLPASPRRPLAEVLLSAPP